MGTGISMAKDVITAIELSNTAIKFIQGKGFASEIILNHADMREVSPSLEVRANTLKEQIQQAVFKPENPVLVISRRRVVLKHLVLPANTDAELRKLIKLRLLDITASAPDQVVWDYFQVGKDPNGYTKVLIFVLNKEMVENEIEVLTRNGLIPSALTVTSLALHRWSIFQMNKTKQTADQPVALINLNNHDAEICFLDQNCFYFSHYINVGINDLSTRMSTFMEQVHSAISTYKVEKIGKDISGFMITADSGELKSKLETVYSLEVEILNNVDLPQSGVAILGTLFAEDLKSLNIMPDKVKNVKFSSWNKKTKRRLIFLFLMTYLLGIAAWSAGMIKKSAYLWFIQEKVTKTQPKIQEIDEINRKIKVLKEESHDQLLVADLIDKLSAFTPEDLTYQFIRLEENNHVVLGGEAHFGSSVNKLQEQLVGSNYFTDVNLEYASKQQTPDGEITRFKINCKISKDSGLSKGS
jgi:Type IV pilus assembly protein PilM